MIKQCFAMIAAQNDVIVRARNVKTRRSRHPCSPIRQSARDVSYAGLARSSSFRCICPISQTRHSSPIGTPSGDVKEFDPAKGKDSKVVPLTNPNVPPPAPRRCGVSYCSETA
jgi:hypothetical protein